MRETYLQLLDSVNTDLEALCERTCDALKHVTVCMENWDKECAERVLKDDAHINEAFIAIQEKCFQIIARQQPVAGDLRFLGSALTVANNLERSGDYAADIGKTIIMMKPKIVDGMKELKEMEKCSEEAMRLAVLGFTKRDIDLSNRVIELESENDAYFGKLLEKLKKGTKNCKEPELLFRTAIVGRHYERFADRAVNITNRTGYVVTADRRYLR
jgi:phosphate transport system protein